MKNIFQDFTREEIFDCLENYNLTEREEKLFLLRCKGYTLGECAEFMDYSDRTISNINRRLLHKVFHG